MTSHADPVIRLAFLGAVQSLRGGSWNDAVQRHTPHVFPSLGRRAARRTLRSELDRLGPVPRLDLRMAGYSWGAWTALHLAAFVLRQPARVHPHLVHADLRIHLGLLDPVGTLRLPARIADDPRLAVWNVFQTNGCYRGCPGASAWYAGRALAGARENLDVTREGRGEPMRDGVPPECAPDHIQLGYRGWGGHDAYVASVLERGVLGPAR